MSEETRCWNDLVKENGRLRAATENVVGAAMLVATAHRLRDQEALDLMMKRLVEAVDGYTAAAEGDA